MGLDLPAKDYELYGQKSLKIYWKKIYLFCSKNNINYQTKFTLTLPIQSLLFNSWNEICNLGKHTFEQISFRKLFITEMSLWGIACSKNCPSGNSLQENCPSKRCLWGTVRQGNVHWGTVQKPLPPGVMCIYSISFISSALLDWIVHFNFINFWILILRRLGF